MRSALVLVLFSLGCAARAPHIEAIADRPRRSALFDASVIDAVARDAIDEERSFGRRAEGGASAASTAVSPPVPRSFAELLDMGVSVYWKTDSARGPVCTRWTPRVADRNVAPHLLTASVSIRCVEYSVNVGASIDASGALVLRGVGGSVTSRTGGHGWGRTPGGPGTAVTWLDADEQRVNTSEGPWFLTQQACEGSSDRVPGRAPSGWSAALSPYDALATARQCDELRWVFAGMESAGPPRAVIAGVERMFRDGATVWEATPDRRSCRSWRVRVDRELRATLERTISARRGARETQRVHLTWRPACGEFEESGCTRTFEGNGINGGAQASSYEGMLYVDEAGPDWIEVGEYRLHETRDGCLRARARSAGALMTACD